MNIRPFEIALIGTFGLIGLVGLFFLANHQPESSEEAQLYGDSVSIWGTFDKEIVEGLLEELVKTNKALEVVTYTEVDSRTFGEELLNAIAEGESPDLVILPHTLLVTYRTKLQVISPETIDPRAFRDTYIDGAEIFLRSDGTYGIPFAVDPLVMYWNRDIFSGSGLALPPKTWETLVSQTVGATVRTDSKYNLTQSTVAFGEYVNVKNAKEVLAMLLMQAGSNIVEETEGGEYRVTLGDPLDNALSPAEAVLTFYTQFVTPGKELYSWNRSKRLDRSEFLSGSLALYFGKGSERGALLRENSNLNFDVVPVPQGADATVKRNYGDFYAFSIPRASDNVQGAYAVANLLADPANSKTLADALDFAPVRRALYDGSAEDPHRQVVYQSALIARGWLDPAPKDTGEVLKTAVEELTSGRERVKSVVGNAVQELEALFE
jgi:ABC-type glycerol-3-phosphate transport system substrate-binding protein